MRRFLAIFLAAIMVIMNSVAIAAPTMETTESVYVNLDYNVAVDQTHVSNDHVLKG